MITKHRVKARAELAMGWSQCLRKSAYWKLSLGSKRAALALSENRISRALDLLRVVHGRFWRITSA
jgi:hypothetical protein